MDDWHVYPDREPIDERDTYTIIKRPWRYLQVIANTDAIRRSGLAQSGASPRLSAA
jgi:hypothetical protein